jgi:hypothetical protein
VSLRHIPAQKGKDFLAGLDIGTVSELPGANMLLITGHSRELTKAGAILRLVDSKEEFGVKTIAPSWSAQDYPISDSRTAELGEILVGTFSNPPVGVDRPKAIVDVHRDAVIAVAPVRHIDRVVSALGMAPPEQGQVPGPAFEPAVTGPVLPVQPDIPVEPNASQPSAVVPGQAALEPAGPPEDESVSDIGEFVGPLPDRAAASDEPAARPDTKKSEADGLFARLLESLAEAEKKTAEPGRDANAVAVVVQEIPRAVPANEPNVAVAPEPTAPSREPPVVAQPRTQELKDIALIEILKRLEALEGATKAQAGPRIEEVPAGIEPNQAADVPKGGRAQSHAPQRTQRC